jgi:hypothetical protein
MFNSFLGMNLVFREAFFLLSGKILSLNEIILEDKWRQKESKDRVVFPVVRGYET